MSARKKKSADYYARKRRRRAEASGKTMVVTKLNRDGDETRAMRQAARIIRGFWHPAWDAFRW